MSCITEQGRQIWGNDTLENAKEWIEEKSKNTEKLLGTNYYSLVNSTIAFTATAYDTVELFTTCTVKPASFIISTITGLALGIIFYLVLSDRQRSEENASRYQIGEDDFLSGSDKNFYVNMTTFVGGPLWTLVSFVSSTAQRFLFRSEIAGFRAGFMAANLFLQILNTSIAIDQEQKGTFEA